MVTMIRQEAPGANTLARSPGSAVAGLLAHPRVNACTIEKRGVRKFIDQAPWYSAGVFQGSVELSLGIPEMMPHFVRQSP